MRYDCDGAHDMESLRSAASTAASCFLMACAAPEAPIFSVDFGPQDDDLLVSYFKKHNVGGNVTLIVGDSQNTKYPEVGQR